MPGRDSWCVLYSVFVDHIHDPNDPPSTLTRSFRRLLSRRTGNPARQKAPMKYTTSTFLPEKGVLLMDSLVHLHLSLRVSPSHCSLFTSAPQYLGSPMRWLLQAVIRRREEEKRSGLEGEPLLGLFSLRHLTHSLLIALSSC